jgi:hypothetical protein
VSHEGCHQWWRIKKNADADGADAREVFREFTAKLSFSALGCAHDGNFYQLIC